jgi:hypothetical protein
MRREGSHLMLRLRATEPRIVSENVEGAALYAPDRLPYC